MVTYPEFSEALAAVAARTDGINAIPLETILDSIPTVDQLEDLAAGTVVLLRCDLDMPVKNGTVVDLSRVQANSPTIKFCAEKGCIVVLFGHLGRRPDTSVAPVCKAYSDELGRDVQLV